MAKNVPRTGGSAALVAFGWLSFILGMLVSNPAWSIPLMVIARVLP